ncbi:TetR/AcrR family transcriptional regulator [Sciscionella marina]|uniref:TetR/AcrR family transcriptional regulator n=1 Tax=Sciscionella marina TaxID=508770 RepID=UPI00036ADFA1|nr:TetR/AcrR family transcriptional regulator [Sciscionella marina]
MTGDPATREHRFTEAGARKYEALLDAAERVMTNQGVDSSLRVIAVEAGVRVGHLQHYFPSRAELIRAALDRVLRRSLNRLMKATGLRTGAADQFVDPEHVVAVVLDEQNDPLLVRLYVEIWALAARDETIAAVVREFYRGYAQHVAEFIGGRCPDLPADVRWARAETFVGLMEGMALVRSDVGGMRRAATSTETARIAVALLTD